MRKTTSENMHIFISVKNIILAEKCIFSIILLCCAATRLMTAADKWSVLNTATAFPPIHPVSQSVYTQYAETWYSGTYSEYNQAH